MADGAWTSVTNVKKNRKKDERKTGSPAAGTTPPTKQSATGQYQPIESISAFAALDKFLDYNRTAHSAQVHPIDAGKARANGRHTRFSNDSDSDDQPSVAPETAASGHVEKAPKQKAPKKPKVTIAQVAETLDAAQLSEFLTQITATYADPEVQLLRCADWFVRPFSEVTPFPFQKLLQESSIAEAAKIPLNSIPQQVQSVASAWISSRTAAALDKFALTLVTQVLERPSTHAPNSKSTKVAPKATPAPQKIKVGLLIMLALVLRARPEAVLQHADYLRQNYSSAETLHSLIWTYSQAAQGDLCTGLAIWVKNLLPLAVSTSASASSQDLALSFAESLLLQDAKKARAAVLRGVSRKGGYLGQPLMPVPAFMTIMRAVDSSSLDGKPLPADVVARLDKLFPLFKEAAYTAFQGKPAKPVAASLLAAALSTSPAAETRALQEVCAAVQWSLTANADCYTQWERSHVSHLRTSRFCLEHLHRNWSSLSTQLSQTELQTMLRGMRAQHKALAQRGTAPASSKKGAADVAPSATELKAAEATCKALEAKMTRFSFCSAMAVVTLVVAAGVAAVAVFADASGEPKLQ
eukprot:jgi/Chlat1/5981/Chrsp4S09083